MILRHLPARVVFVGGVLLALMSTSNSGLGEPAHYAGKDLRPTYLRCEYKVNPLGIDEPAPRLSWIVESGQRGQRQTACRVIVATSEKLLKRNDGDLWDTGKLATDETIGLPYAGIPLGSHQRCYWKVMVWDKDGKASAWSEPAFWTMGLLEAADWTGEWIGFDKARQPKVSEAPLDGAKWIWHAADPAGNAPKCERMLVGAFSLPADSKVTEAELFITATDGLKVGINGHQIISTDPKPESWRRARKAITVAQLRPGQNEIRIVAATAGPGPAGVIAQIRVLTEDGQTFVRTTDESWKSTDQPGDNWLRGKADTFDWSPVRVIGDYGVEPWSHIEFVDTFLPPAPMLRTAFKAEKAIARATLYGTALGLVDFYLNGNRVSPDYFTPGWTDYAKRVYYRTYDVTSLVRRGDNAFGAILADGWFSGYLGFRGNREIYGTKPRIRAQLRLEFTDGSVMDVATGPDWKAAFGPTLEADFLKGETYDARLEQKGWSEPNFDGSHWEPVVTGSTEVHPLLQAHPGPPVRAVHEFPPIETKEPKPGVYVFDLGQNFAGIVRLTIRGKAGQKLRLRYAERLNPDGTIYTVNLRSARAIDTYICRGGEIETWQPRFTFHGFQYVEVTGVTEPPPNFSVIGIALSSDTPVAGGFSCSDPMLNQLHENIFWTQRANFIDIPTDCPQRDERMGWTGDAQVYVRTATLNTDVQTFFTKWLVDLDDAQRPDGQFPRVAPTVVTEPDGGPAWSDAGVICPWTIYQVYGDKRELERHYPAMVRFIEFCRERSGPSLLPPVKYHSYGDWLSINADTPKDVIYTAYFAHSADLTARAAEVLGHTEDAAKYRRLFEQVRNVFNQTYVSADGRVRGNTQAAYVLALAFGLLQGEAETRAASYLIEDIEKRGWHLSTGFIGTKDLMLTLSQIGSVQTAYRLLHNDTFPSWGFSIKQGATSIWERWDGWTPEKGFQDAGMNSFAHYSFGAVYQWMVENIGGIRAESPSYKTIVIAPQLDRKLSHASVFYDSIRGRILTVWQRRKEGALYSVEVSVPANVTARLHLPKPAPWITESGKRLDQAIGVTRLPGDRESVILELGSGNYSFDVMNTD